MKIFATFVVIIFVSFEICAHPPESPQVQIGNKVRVTTSEIHYSRIDSETREINIETVGTLVAMGWVETRS